MAKTTQTVYVDGKGREVLRETKPGRFDFVGIYGSVNVKDAVRLHASLGELLTDLAAEGRLPAEEPEEATA